MKHDYPAVIRLATAHFRSLAQRTFSQEDDRQRGQNRWIADRLAEAEELITDQADVLDCLREIGKLLGSENVQTSDGRQNLVRSVVQSLARDATGLAGPGPKR
jgi:hypothetical protein